jgi:hypothetical protein
MENGLTLKPDEIRDIGVTLFAKHFPEVSMSSVMASVFTPEEDPGEWAKNSVMVVHCESGIPDKYTYEEAMPVWEAVEIELSEAIGREVYFESINSAVSALYYV